ncbi:MAG TPA: transglycosylase domain-containing protein, partial [Gammaproteobacteria bacterium]|nr:transglycosylase domain-containing protein [Gammaproteobacteria bacterium]
MRWALLLSLLFTLPVAAVYGLWLDYRVTTEFEGKRWALPARVYARPLELFEGLSLRPDTLEAELRALNYRPEAGGRQPGTYQRSGDRFTITTRAFQFPDGTEPGRTLEVQFAGRQISSLRGEGEIDLVRLDPALIGSIYPAHQEDRILVKLEEVPPLLVDALLALEDREFFQHRGISFSGVGRALYANLKAGRVVQGGSTITQQLVKNFFLSSERTMVRKANEALMALLLEAHYSKQEILEAYLNEVYLGQDGPRAIHGFGMAAEYYFARPLNELQPHQLALLAAIVRGPSYYDPRRHPQRARARRDHVLTVLADQARLDVAATQAARGRALEVTPQGR